MAFGLRCKNSAGATYLDETDRLPALFGNGGYSAAFDPGQEQDTVGIPGISPSTHFAFSRAADFSKTNSFLYVVQTNQVQVTRIREDYSVSEFTNFDVFRM